MVTPTPLETPAKRRSLAARFNEAFSNLDLQTPTERENAHHVYHQYTLRIPAPIDRSKIQAHLTSRGIGNNIFYPVALHLQPVFQGLGYREGQAPGGKFRDS